MFNPFNDDNMAYVKNNIVTEGLSGKLGNTIVFRQVGGKTIVASKPTKTKRESSEAQKNHQRRFRAASRYAKQVIQNPDLKAAYQQQAPQDQSAYNVAIADYMNRPEIADLDLSTYTGGKGNALVVEVTDDYMVADVEVAIYSKAGTLLEQGPAELDGNGINWIYTTQKANGQLSGSKLVIRASDLPGNTTEKATVLG